MNVDENDVLARAEQYLGLGGASRSQQEPPTQDAYPTTVDVRPTSSPPHLQQPQSRDPVFPGERMILQDGSMGLQAEILEIEPSIYICGFVKNKEYSFLSLIAPFSFLIEHVDDNTASVVESVRRELVDISRLLEVGLAP